MTEFECPYCGKNQPMSNPLLARIEIVDPLSPRVLIDCLRCQNEVTIIPGWDLINKIREAQYNAKQIHM